MNQKRIKELVLSSYSNNILDNKKVEKISGLLPRSELKKYIKALKNKEERKKIHIAVPKASIYNKTKQIFIDIFPDKEIYVTEDRLLMLGAKIKYADMVYDFSLGKRLDDFLDFIDENYD